MHPASFLGPDPPPPAPHKKATTSQQIVRPACPATRPPDTSAVAPPRSSSLPSLLLSYQHPSGQKWYPARRHAPFKPRRPGRQEARKLNMKKRLMLKWLVCTYQRFILGCFFFSSLSCHRAQRRRVAGSRSRTLPMSPVVSRPGWKVSSSARAT